MQYAFVPLLCLLFLPAAAARAAPLVEVYGTVREVWPGAQFLVELGNDHAVICDLMDIPAHPAIIMPGDKVAVKLNPHDMSKGTIIWRDA